MRDVAVVSYASSTTPKDDIHNEVEMLGPVLREVMAGSGIARGDIGFVCSGSLDYLQGGPFAFVMGLDAVGAWPPIRESHVEMDAAWALYEAWVAIQTGEVDTALVYGFGKSSLGDVHEIMTLQTDPYYVAPLWPSMVDMAGLQASAATGAGALIAADDIFPITDGSAAIVLAADDVARKASKRPAWIRGIEHRIECHGLGVRDLTISESTRMAAEAARVGDGPVDVAELHAQFRHEEAILAEAIGLDGHTTINPSGGPLAANPIMSAGLMRIGEVAKRISAGEANRGVAHATSGPCLQQNMVVVLEGN